MFDYLWNKILGIDELGVSFALIVYLFKRLAPKGRCSTAPGVSPGFSKYDKIQAPQVRNRKFHTCLNH